MTTPLVILQDVQDICDLVRLGLPDGMKAHIDPLHLGGHYAFHILDQTLSYRFVQDGGAWRAEYRNVLCDPPGQYDALHDDGPVVGAPAPDVASWALSVLGVQP